MVKRTTAASRKAKSPQARYDAAGTGRRIASWNPPASGARVATENTSRLRDRSRDAARNDWGGSSASQRWVTNLIGVGIRPQFRRVPEGPERVMVNDLWADFVKEADADGVLDFYGIEALVTRTWFDSGEAFIRMRPRPLGLPLKIPLQVQVLEGDYCPISLSTTVWPGLPAGNQIRQGIELNNYGRRTAYWMYREHPGDARTPVSPQQLLRVPASQVLHVFEPTRPGQLRGVSQLSSVLVRLRSAGDLEDSVLDRQKLANLFMMFVTRQMPPDWDDVDVDAATGLPKFYDPTYGRAVTAMSPGTSHELLPGEDVKFANPPEAGISHSDYIRTVGLGTAAGANLPYELHSGDIRGVSDRTLRMIVLEFRRLAEQRQWLMLIPMMCQPVVEAFCTACVLAGKITVSLRDAVCRPTWAPHGWENIHPLQDPQGRVLEIAAGLRSRSGVISARGDAREDIDAERADDKQSEQKLGLTSIANDPTHTPTPL